MPFAPDSVFAGYRIVRLLGTGGMGEVYLAQHPRLPRYDALKIMPADLSANPEFRDRFHREADLVAVLYHPHIIGVHDRGEYQGQLWISMDYIDGPDAGRYLREQFPGGIPRRTVAEIVCAVADALDYAHSRGLLHRDVKPANILLTDPRSGVQRILLADFGIARSFEEIDGITKTNTVLGTVSYAAPEQLMGHVLDGRTDQYELAATAYELLTGATLFADPNPTVVISRHLNAQPTPLAMRRPDLADLDPVMARALAKNPDDRFGRCVHFARAFADPNLMLGQPNTTPTRPARKEPTRVMEPVYPVPAAAPPEAPSKGWLISGAVLAAIALLFVIAFVFRPFKGDRDAAPTAVPTATTTSTTSAPAPITPDSMRAAVTALYGNLPARPMDAWQLFDSNYQNRTGLQDFQGFWSTIQSVTVLNVSTRDASSVVARLQYVRTDGHVDTEDRWLSFVSKDGRLLVYDSERIGPADNGNGNGNGKGNGPRPSGARSHGRSG
jgi:serine/threonine-protein kinase